MGAAFSDITIYAQSLFAEGTAEFAKDGALKNYISDLYTQKMNGYKPPGITRITIHPGYHGDWNRTWKRGSIVAIAPYFNAEEYTVSDKMGKYRSILDLIQVSTLQLSEEYQWDKTVFENAYQEIIRANYEFIKEYPVKMSRDKKKYARVQVEKTETTTRLNLIFTINGIEKKVQLFEKRNWYWYNSVYELAKHSKWLDKHTFGVYSKQSDRFGYYSLLDDVIIGKLDFNKNDFPE